MKNHLTWVLVVLFHFAGCAPRKVVSLPADSSNVPTNSESLLELGQVATIHLVSGEVVEGRIVALESEFVVVGIPGNYGLAETKYSASEISKIEVASSDGGVDAVFFVVTAMVVGVLAVFSNGFRGWGGW